MVVEKNVGITERFFDNHYKGRSSVASVRLYKNDPHMSINRLAHSIMVSGFSVQVSGFWSLATGQKRETSSQNAGTRLRTEAAIRGKDLTPDT